LHVVAHGSIQAFIDLKQEYVQVFGVAKSSATSIRPKATKVKKPKAGAKDPPYAVIEGPPEPQVLGLSPTQA
jgi:hypothetical protein